MAYEHTDIVVVGAGPSGAVAAHELSSAGFNVVVLERGDWHEPAEFTGDTPQWPLHAEGRWNANPNRRRNPADYSIDNGFTEIEPLMFAGVGGTALIYGAHWSRMMPVDFELKRRFDAADDWPFGYEELAPYYEYVETLVGVSGLSGNPLYPDGSPVVLPPLPMGTIGRRAVQGLEALGWRWWPGSNAIASRAYRGLNPCALRGTCAWGCPEGAKFTPDRWLLRSAERQGSRILTRSKVVDIETDAQGRASGVVYLDAEGLQRRLSAGAVILCANGIGTPRLLLASAGGKGLANRSDQVGRRLMFHTYASVVGLFDDPLDSWQGPAGQRVTSQHFYESDPARGYIGGAKWNVMPTFGPVQALQRLKKADALGNWGSAFHRRCAEEIGHSFEWGIIGEDLPEAENRVTLSDLTDKGDGLPMPRIHYRVADNTRRLQNFHAARASEAMRAAGARDLSVVSDVRESGWHIMGTARMGEDPETSVTDPFGRCHDVKNLFIWDASTFPTSAGVNPTPTLMALAARGALNLIENRREITVA